MNKTHGLAKTRINNIYHNMKNRCYNPNNRTYSNYGGRGVIICGEWLDKDNGFINFYNWAMENGYQDNLTIDRINVNGNYEPDNCRWIPMQEQFYNKTDNVYYELNGFKKCLAEWCKEYNMPYQTVRKRLERGKNIFEALTMPIDTKYRKKYTKERKM